MPEKHGYFSIYYFSVLKKKTAGVYRIVDSNHSIKQCKKGVLILTTISAFIMCIYMFKKAKLEYSNIFLFNQSAKN